MLLALGAQKHGRERNVAPHRSAYFPDLGQLVPERTKDPLTQGAFERRIKVTIGRLPAKELLSCVSWLWKTMLP